MSDTLHWFKSSYSNSEGGNCVQVARCPTAMHVRDSKLSSRSPELAFPAEPWADFLTYAMGSADH
ncbi:DUF397 domain-containing protein [Streptomyces sp. NPDC048211]|uniref:DUF397 domain-containing protein n=1 Tax=Streptomyces sp. NPDC048211 TaxID=3365516 RepID=UPI0037214B10